jgi:uncharacterized membrane protein YkvA (DUF1232 family)
MIALLLRMKLLWRIRRYVAAFVRLFFDRRVSMSLKVAATAGALLILSPIDLLSDIPVLGALDDVALLALLAALFVRLSPSAAVADYFGGHRASGLKNVTPKN